MAGQLLFSAIVTGLLMGGFYAAVSIGLQIAFGLLDIPHFAYPSIVVAGGYGAFTLGRAGIDPLVAAVLLIPVFFCCGILLYRFYHYSFERRAEDLHIRAFCYFLGLAFVIQSVLSLTYGADQRMVDAPYLGHSLIVNEDLRLPWRLVFGCAGGLLVSAILGAFMSFTYLGKAIKAVAQDQEALAMIGADPVRVKQWAFGISTAIAGVAGGLLAVVGPLDPGLGDFYIGKVFAICVLGGLGSIGGTLIAAFILGVSESVVLASSQASLAPAVSFAILLILLAFRPSGLFGVR